MDCEVETSEGSDLSVDTTLGDETSVSNEDTGFELPPLLVLEGARVYAKDASSGNDLFSQEDVKPECRNAFDRKSGSKRAKAQQWTEEEHLCFLVGLQKLGKGNWSAVSRNYVRTRTPAQVASHAQKHFLRLSTPAHGGVRKRRSRFSLLDNACPSSLLPTAQSADAEPSFQQENQRYMPETYATNAATVRAPCFIPGRSAICSKNNMPPVYSIHIPPRPQLPIQHPDMHLLRPMQKIPLHQPKTRVFRPRPYHYPKPMHVQQTHTSDWRSMVRELAASHQPLNRSTASAFVRPPLQQVF
ncbi:hypothetical protein CYMTET_14604 [Cymbomonas tetramitiformis]|uniref:Uncharacterized protein n=1 Tax=Cymbomonas tetramitiformis TaxID=36881 RepID=A0AAE0LA70_9CHLO|nr:hypothetical protein CYMTET_14604 [Cymbomonas tetramitiformis]